MSWFYFIWKADCLNLAIRILRLSVAKDYEDQVKCSSGVTNMPDPVFWNKLSHTFLEHCVNLGYLKAVPFWTTSWQSGALNLNELRKRKRLQQLHLCLGKRQLSQDCVILTTLSPFLAQLLNVSGM